jgi:Zn ribbon nucleic-acid-binding protein
MRKVITQCLYCGKEDMIYIYSEYELTRLKCNICGDKKFKTKSVDKSNVFGYPETEVKTEYLDNRIEDTGGD